MPSALTSPPRYRRGIYRAKYTIDGYGVLFGIKSNGDRLRKIIVLRPGVPEARAANWLQQVLDRVDPLPLIPPPRLRLVTDQPQSHNLTAAQLEAIYRDLSPTARLLAHRKRQRTVTELTRAGLPLPPRR